MKELIFWIVVFILIIATLMLPVSGCAILKGTGITKPPAEVPEPGRQLWNAAKKSNWLVTASILGIAAGVFALVNGSTKLGSAAIASSSVSLFMALAVARFAVWMAVFGLIGSALAALFSILVRRKALVEIIRGVQNLKDAPADKIYYSKVANNILDVRQSKTTKRIVGNLKNELRLKGVI